MVKYIKSVKDKLTGFFRARDNIGVILLSFALVLTIIFAIYMHWPLFAVNQELKAAKKPPAAKKIITYPVAESEKEIIPPAIKVKKEVSPPIIKIREAEIDPRSLTNPFALRARVTRKVKGGDRPDGHVQAPTKEAIPLLEGIWVDANMKVAFLDQQAVSVGEIVNGWRVTRISKKTVTIQKGKRVKILKLGVE